MPDAETKDDAGRPLGQLMETVYGTLRALAGRQLRNDRNRIVLDPTELVHECYLKLADAVDDAGLDRPRFVALASKVIRQVLVDQARARGAQKRGGAWGRVTLHEDAAVDPNATLDVLDLDGALARLAELDPRQSQVVELRFFGGLTNVEAAAVLEISPRTANDEWAMARAWLKRELSRGLNE